jgi:hypothetical protein
MSTPGGSRLPRRVFFAFIGLTVVGLSAAFVYSVASGWTPLRSASAFVLPLYFAALLSVLTVSFVISGNTLMRHFRTGTVQRATDPRWFWSIVIVQSIIAGVLLVVGYVKWSAVHG